MTRKQTSVHVLDSSILIELVHDENKENLLTDLIEALDNGVIQLVMPEVVRNECSGFDKAQKRKKSNWSARVCELKKFSQLLQNKTVRNDLIECANRFQTAINSYDREAAWTIFEKIKNHNSTLHISANRTAKDMALKYALEKKAPFHRNKNSVADAVLLFSTYYWSKRRRRRVIFHTLNVRDFSGHDNRKPHPDLQSFFGVDSVLEYSVGIDRLAKELESCISWPSELTFEEGECDICGQPVLISDISCLVCGELPDSIPDNEDYSLTRRGNGYLVDVGFDDPYGFGPSRLKCSHCGRKTFHVELENLCAYHSYYYDR